LLKTSIAKDTLMITSSKETLEKGGKTPLKIHNFYSVKTDLAWERMGTPQTFGGGQIFPNNSSTRLA
jgi:hypothetical protein